MTSKILIVDDEQDMLSTCRETLRGFSIVLERDALKAKTRLGQEDFDLVLADIKMPGLDGLGLLTAAKSSDSDIPVILMTAYPEAETAIQALRAGALDYLIKPVHPEDLRQKVERAIGQRRLEKEHRLLAGHVGMRHKPAQIIGQSQSIKELLDLVDRIAPTPVDVLVMGESGTGKELVARRIHDRSGRKGHFVPVDCGAIPELLLENELFGHEKGAYTDAGANSPGLLEFADQGTFFMDEVGELPRALQAKLLRTLQERQFRRIGGKDLRTVDVRVIAATNKDLLRESHAGRFRDDLYYRLNVVTIQIPPLRQRREDIPLLVEHYLQRFAGDLGRAIRRVEDEALDILCHYAWPGNVRELQNVIKKSIVLADGGFIRAADLPRQIAEDGVAADAEPGGFPDVKKKHIEDFERGYFQSLLKAHGGNARMAAEAAKLPLSNFYWYLKKYGFKPASFQ